jgi:methylphosphotriester-DNA--protein-cysteine methyltransferase
MSNHGYGRTEIHERFDTGALDEDVWTAAYLPAWSSAREAAATYALDDGATFRQLLLEVRQELAHEYLHRPEMDVTEVAFLLGYEDSNSFYRAFRTWEGTTPSQLRAALRRSETRQ